MVAKYPKHLFIVSFALTLVVFMAGLLLGFSLDNFRSSDILSSIKLNELETESYIVGESFLDNFEDNKCDTLSLRINEIKRITTKVGSQLSGFDEKSMTIKGDMDYLKRKYTILEVKFLVMLHQFKKECGTKVTTILFFYTKDDSDSKKQGYVLTDLSKRYKEDMVILSIDKDYTDESLVKMLKLKYDIQKSSTLVIDNEIKLEGFVSKDKLDQIIMERLG